jgi:hypothetical protein
MNTLHGHCHCGNLELTMATALQPEALPVRECQCSFCRSHGARASSDPHGSLRIRVEAAEDLSRYRFGLRTADFLICKRCGNYLAAVMTMPDGRTCATANINLFDAAQRFTQPPVAVSYTAETAEQRRARRLANWTPVASFT